MPRIESDSDCELILPSDEELVKEQDKKKKKKVNKEELESDSGEAGPSEKSSSTPRKTRTNDALDLPVTAAETKYRVKYFSGSKILDQKLNCTSCNKNLKSHVAEGKDIFNHPALRVLVCKDCCLFYGDGSFSVDEDGSDKYCRWCGQGGSLYCCASCSCAFCKSCMKRNLHRSIFDDVEQDDWKCFVCNPKPLWDLRAVCGLAQDYANKIKRKQNRDKKEKLIELATKSKEEKEARAARLKQRKSAARSSAEVSDTDGHTLKKKTGRDDSSDNSEFERLKRSSKAGNKKKGNERENISDSESEEKSKHTKKQKHKSADSEDDEPPSKGRKSVSKKLDFSTKSKTKSVTKDETSGSDSEAEISKKKNEMRKKKKNDGSESEDEESSKRKGKKSVKNGDVSDSEETSTKGKSRKHTENAVQKKKKKDDTDCDSESENVQRKKQSKTSTEIDSNKEASKKKEKKSLEKERDVSSKRRRSDSDSEPLKKPRKASVEKPADVGETKKKSVITASKVDEKTAKRACVWLEDACKDISKVAEVTVARSKAFCSEKVNVEYTQRVKNVAKIVDGLQLLVSLSVKNLNVASETLALAHKSWLERIARKLAGAESTETENTEDDDSRRRKSSKKQNGDSSLVSGSDKLEGKDKSILDDDDNGNESTDTLIIENRDTKSMCTGIKIKSVNVINTELAELAVPSKPSAKAGDDDDDDILVISTDKPAKGSKKKREKENKLVNGNIEHNDENGECEVIPIDEDTEPSKSSEVGKKRSSKDSRREKESKDNDVDGEKMEVEGLELEEDTAKQSEESQKKDDELCEPSVTEENSVQNEVSEVMEVDDVDLEADVHKDVEKVQKKDKNKDIPENDSCEGEVVNDPSKGETESVEAIDASGTKSSENSSVNGKDLGKESEKEQVAQGVQDDSIVELGETEKPDENLGTSDKIQNDSVIELEAAETEKSHESSSNKSADNLGEKETLKSDDSTKINQSVNDIFSDDSITESPKETSDCTAIKSSHCENEKNDKGEERICGVVETNPENGEKCLNENEENESDTVRRSSRLTKYTDDALEAKKALIEDSDDEDGDASHKKRKRRRKGPQQERKRSKRSKRTRKTAEKDNDEDNDSWDSDVSDNSESSDGNEPEAKKACTEEEIKESDVVEKVDDEINGQGDKSNDEIESEDSNSKKDKELKENVQKDKNNTKEIVDTLDEDVVMEDDDCDKDQEDKNSEDENCAETDAKSEGDGKQTVESKDDAKKNIDDSGGTEQSSNEADTGANPEIEATKDGEGENDSKTSEGKSDSDKDSKGDPEKHIEDESGAEKKTEDGSDADNSSGDNGANNSGGEGDGKDSDNESDEKQKEKSERAELNSLLNLKTLKKRRGKKGSNDSDESSEDESSEKSQAKQTPSKKTKKQKDAIESLKDFMNLSDSDEQSVVSLDEDGKLSDIEASFRELGNQLEKKRSEMAKKELLDTSSSDLDSSGDDNDSKKKKKKTMAKEDVEKKTKVKKEVAGSGSEEEEEDEEESDDNAKKKKKWRTNKLLRGKLVETSSSEEDRKWKAKKEREAQGLKESKKKSPRLKGSDSDSDDARIESSDSESDFSVKRKSKGKTGRSTSSSEEDKSSDSDDKKKSKPKPKPRRRRIKKVANSDSDSSGDQQNASKGDTPGKGRKNIRAVLEDDSVEETTRKAAKAEEERRKRIAEKQAMYNKLYNELQDGVEKVEKLVLDFDPETKEELVKVDEKLVSKMKPHQAKGVKFMWDACFESLKDCKKGTGSGCILAHCMGLGKTFQVVSLIHTLLSYRETKVKTILVVCPLSTVLNWVNEFNMWLKETNHEHEVEVFELTRYRQNYERAHQLKEWHNDGGVMVIGYEMFRNLVNIPGKRARKSIIETFQTTLLDPGADLVVCDEGHLLKNEDTALSKAMRKIRTLRRIVLTGTPLQNNLIEYHCMVQFVKPNLLGTRKEFGNRFVNPITNGQFEDSTSHDVKIMKRRAHVLHKMLEGCVQRFDYSVLMPFLPPKHEYVITIRLTKLQSEMYQHYLIHCARGGAHEGGKGARLFADYQALQRVWTHPRVLRMNADKMEKIAERKELDASESEGSLKDFIDDSTTEPSSSSDSSNSDSDNSSGSEKEEKKKKKKENKVVPRRATRSSRRNAEDKEDGSVEEVKEAKEAEQDVEMGEESVAKPRQWWEDFIKGDEMEDMRESGKLMLLFSILRDSEKIGDKVLVFSQSLYSLDLMEYFLERIDEATQNNEVQDNLGSHLGSWSRGLDYFRLDGSTSSENRNLWCKAFNREDNLRARLFLISTRAGGLGINLYAANRVIIFDASWNPSHDVQSIFRVYRFGQKKPCYIYRFLALGTMEEKIYDRQVAKLSLSCRVVDEQQIERHFNFADLNELYNFDPEQKTKRPTPILPKDRMLAELLKEHESVIETYHEHDSLLENKQDEELNEEERRAAWEEYENEKKGKVLIPNPLMANPGQGYANPFAHMNPAMIRTNLKNQNPTWTEQQLQEQFQQIIRQIYDYTSAANGQVMNSMGMNSVPWTQMQPQMHPQIRPAAQRPIQPGRQQLQFTQTLQPANMQEYMWQQQLRHQQLSEQHLNRQSQMPAQGLTPQPAHSNSVSQPRSSSLARALAMDQMPSNKQPNPLHNRPKAPVLLDTIDVE